MRVIPTSIRMGEVFKVTQVDGTLEFPIATGAVVPWGIGVPGEESETDDEDDSVRHGAGPGPGTVPAGKLVSGEDSVPWDKED